jgi:hypothetical protein
MITDPACRLLIRYGELMELAPVPPVHEME